MTRLLTVLESGPQTGSVLIEVQGFTRTDIAGAVSRGLTEWQDPSVPYAQRVLQLTAAGEAVLEGVKAPAPPIPPAAPPPTARIDYSNALGPVVEDEYIDSAELMGIIASHQTIAVAGGLYDAVAMPVLVEGMTGELEPLRRVQLWVDPETGRPVLILGLS